MTEASKTWFLLLLSMALLTGCKSSSGEDSRQANNALAGSPTLTTNTERLSSVSAAAREQTGYLSKSDDGATFIQWAKTDRQIKGQMQIFDMKRTGETDSKSYSFEGISDGNNVSLSFRDRYLTFLEGRTITGTLKSDVLTLVWPQRDGTLWTQVYRLASVADYNYAVRNLQERASQIVAAKQEAARQAQAAREEAAKIAAERLAVVDAHKRITDTAEELRREIKRLCGQTCFISTLKAYATEWKTMQAEYAILKQQASLPLDSYQLNTVKYHLNSLKYHLNSHNYQRNSFDSDARDADDRIKEVNDLINRLNAGWERLQQAVSANTTGEPRAAITTEQISKAVEYARSEINKSVATQKAAQKQAATYDKQAEDLYRQAEAFVKTLKAVDR